MATLHAWYAGVGVWLSRACYDGNDDGASHGYNSLRLMLRQRCWLHVAMKAASLVTIDWMFQFDAIR
eukprot:58812-Pleurochrysis_carterae.AAC.1